MKIKVNKMIPALILTAILALLLFWFKYTKIPVMEYTLNVVPFVKDQSKNYQVVLQIGHCAYDQLDSCDAEGFVKKQGTHFGDIKEPEMTKYIALKTREYLIDAGLNPSDILIVGATKGDINQLGKSSANMLVSLHMDGANKECVTGASVGYPSWTSSSFVSDWKQLYGQYFPYKWMNDNFTDGLKHYYLWGKSKVTSPESYNNVMLVEFGELTCNRQFKWLMKNRDNIGYVLGEFLATTSKNNR